MAKAIIFDCDGVLVDSDVLAIRGERVALADFGLEYTPEAYVERFVGMHDGLFFEALREDYRGQFGADAPADFEDRVLDGRRRHSAELTAIAGADRALAAAQAAAETIAVASSSRAHYLQSKLTRTGLYDLAAPHVYSADLVANGKPAPDIFLYTAEKIGADPAECLVLEDSRNGVAAGLAAGMQVWGFIGGGHASPAHGARLTEAGASRVIKDFDDFVAAIAAC